MWSLGSEDATETPTVKRFKALTNSPVWTVSPSWSPRGEFIAYSEMTTQGIDVFVKPSSGGVPELRASTPGDDVSPRISPDGSTLAFVSSAEPGSPVCLVSVQGDRRRRRVVDTRIPTLNVTALIDSLGDRPWYPDGNSLLVSIVDPNGRMAVHRVELASGEVEQLTFPEIGHDDRAASLSFDGERVVFHREGAGGSSLWTIPAQGGEAVPLIGDDAGRYSPAWRPDGERIVFRRSTHGGFYDLWELSTTTGDLRRITFETRRVWSLSISADDRIAYSSSEHDTFLHTVSRTGGQPRLVNAHTGDNFGARPSPDGEKIAYHSNREGRPGTLAPGQAWRAREPAHQGILRRAVSRTGLPTAISSLSFPTRRAGSRCTSWTSRAGHAGSWSTSRSRSTVEHHQRQHLRPLVAGPGGPDDLVHRLQRARKLAVDGAPGRE